MCKFFLAKSSFGSSPFWLHHKIARKNIENQHKWNSKRLKLYQKFITLVTPCHKVFICWRTKSKHVVCSRVQIPNPIRFFYVNYAISTWQYKHNVSTQGIYEIPTWGYYIHSRLFVFMQYLHMGVDKKNNCDIKYCLSKQFQVPSNTFIFFLSSLISIVVRLVRKTTKEVGATKQMGFGKYLLH